MIAVKVGSSWRIKIETGDFVGWYLTEIQAKRGIEKKLRDRLKNTFTSEGVNRG